MTYKKTIPQMFDMKPVDEAGVSSWQKTHPSSNKRQSEIFSNEQLWLQEELRLMNSCGRIVSSKQSSELCMTKNHESFVAEREIDWKTEKIKQAEENERQRVIKEIETYRQQQKIVEMQRQREEQIQREREMQLKELAERQAAVMKEQEIRKQAEENARIIAFKEQQRIQAEMQREEELRKQQIIIQQQEQQRLHQLKIQKQARIQRQKFEEENRMRQRQLFEQEKMRQAQLEQQEYNRKQEEERMIRREIERQQQILMQQEVLRQKMAEEETLEIQRKLIRQEEIRKIADEKREKQSKIKKSRGSINRDDKFTFADLFISSRNYWGFNLKKFEYTFSLAMLLVIVGIGSVAFVSKGFNVKGRVLGVSQDGYENLNSAVQSMTKRNFDGSTIEFEKAYDNFSQASSELDDLGGVLIDATRFIPFASSLSTGKNVVDAGKHISRAGQSLSEVVRVAATFKNPLNQQQNSSLLEMFQSTERNIADAKNELLLAKNNIDKVNVDDLPKEKQQKFILLKQKLPEIIALFEGFNNNSHIFTDLLGGNGPRKYLFLFQNNNEMRATGGFVGTYGLMDISKGNIRKFYIDGIFNPDGQLKEKIVPPEPIQKISAAWSLHDSNWFPDFPTSAGKAISFFEKTGGPTVDGVITLTPTVMQDLLKVTGPIYMEDYDVTLDSDNFIEKTQYEVEVDYDKVENKPKKILSDLAPIILDRILNTKDITSMSKALKALTDGLTQKHILLYSENKELQQIISNQGWSGEVLSSTKDYLSVINTNINGYKTDGVVTESIEHNAEIQNDGSIINTVSITRRHNGGDSELDWWNKVNADYMRVYVPKGAQLLDVQGQTREVNKSPLDYDALGFNRDELVQKEELSMTIDQRTGTRVYEDSGKTVFANWIYVSPKESVTVVYKYLLPFKLFQIAGEEGKQIDSYSLVAQKQSGSLGSDFESVISYPENYAIEWKNSDNLKKSANIISFDSKLDADRFIGLVFQKK